MAEQEEVVSERADAGGGSLLGAMAGIAGAVLTGAAMLGSMVWHAVTDDGMLARRPPGCR